MKVDRYASLSHYAEHVDPIWQILIDRGLAGDSWAPRVDCWWGTSAGRRDVDRPVLVAGLADHQRMHPSRTILVEHGAGQTYTGLRSGSYSGGPGWTSTILFLCPNETVAGRWQSRYDAPAVAVGCPKLDRWLRGSSIESAGQTPDRPPVPPSGSSTVAVTFHWECRLVPETRSAWGHYDRALPDLVAWADRNRIELLGHGHPRLWGKIRRRWETLGVEPVAEFAEVLDRADVLVADNTSAAPEFASTGRPVLWLNAPWYRRDVEHGGRFWDWPRGQIQVDQPEELPGAIAIAIADPPSVQMARRRMVEQIYGVPDGAAAVRAADAIESVLP